MAMKDAVGREINGREGCYVTDLAGISAFGAKRIIRHRPMAAKCQDRPSRWFTEAGANGQKQSLDHYSSGRHKLRSRSSYLYATAGLDGPVSEGDHPEVSESGLRDA
jgi:hypothetical protein